jgi:hypothetical protein
MCRETIAVCREIHIKYVIALWEQSVEYFNVKPGGTYSNHSSLHESEFYL